MTHTVPERLDSLSREQAPGGVPGGAGNHHRDTFTARAEFFVNGEKCRLGIEGVKNGFDHQHIRPAFEQRGDLFPVRGTQGVKRDLARPRVVHIA